MGEKVLTKTERQTGLEHLASLPLHSQACKRRRIPHTSLKTLRRACRALPKRAFNGRLAEKSGTRRQKRVSGVTRRCKRRRQQAAAAAAFANRLFLPRQHFAPATNHRPAVAPHAAANRLRLSGRRRVRITRTALKNNGTIARLLGGRREVGVRQKQYKAGGGHRQVRAATGRRARQGKKYRKTDGLGRGRAASPEQNA